MEGADPLHDRDAMAALAEIQKRGKARIDGLFEWACREHPDAKIVHAGASIRFGFEFFIRVEK